MAARRKGNRRFTTPLTAIDVLQRSVNLTMASFVSGQDRVDALTDAPPARPGRAADPALFQQLAPVLHARRSRYTELRASGAELHGLQSVTLHAKTLVVEGVGAAVGSSHLDWQSFAANSKFCGVVLVQDFGNTMMVMFGCDLGEFKCADPTTWPNRP